MSPRPRSFHSGGSASLSIRYSFDLRAKNQAKRTQKKLKLQYPTVTARLHADIDEKITIFIEMKKFLKSKIFKVKNIFKVD